MEHINSLGFIHGDINNKNIIHTEDGYKIIDYEPDLYQIKNGKKQLMVTLPYTSKYEYVNKLCLTTTDKLGFFYYVRRLSGKFNARDIVRLSKNFAHPDYIGMTEIEFNKLSYLEILTLSLGC